MTLCYYDFYVRADFVCDDIFQFPSIFSIGNCVKQVHTKILVLINSICVDYLIFNFCSYAINFIIAAVGSEKCTCFVEETRVYITISYVIIFQSFTYSLINNRSVLQNQL